MTEIILILIIIILFIIIFFLIKAITKARKDIKEIKSKYQSKVVLHGTHWEQFVPFTEEFSGIANIENAKFLGKPIDYIVFDNDAVKFIEVKTGKSGLSQKERKIRNLIKDKKVQWFELRY